MTVHGTVGHLPRTLPLTGQPTVAEVPGGDAVIRAIGAVESADVSEEHFTTIGGDCTEYEHAARAGQEVAEKNIRNAEQELKREKREMRQARERAERRASIATRNLKNTGLPRIPAPRILLLDEPTNNLDLVGVGQLESALARYRGAFALRGPVSPARMVT